MERKRSLELFALSQVHLTEIIGVLTEHCSIGTQEAKDFERRNLSKLYVGVEVETTRNFFLHYLALARLR